MKHGSDSGKHLGDVMNSVERIQNRRHRQNHSLIVPNEKQARLSTLHNSNTNNRVSLR